jgi:hypothetical protein
VRAQDRAILRADHPSRRAGRRTRSRGDPAGHRDLGT